MREFLDLNLVNVCLNLVAEKFESSFGQAVANRHLLSIVIRFNTDQTNFLINKPMQNKLVYFSLKLDILVGIYEFE